MSRGGAEAQYFEYLSRGQFKLQRNSITGEFVFYPRESLRDGEVLDWVDASGLGTVYSTTTVRQRPEKGGIYNVALIDLDEGVRMMSRVVDIDPEAVHIGMRVSARIASDPDNEDRNLIEFVPESGS